MKSRLLQVLSHDKVLVLLAQIMIGCLVLAVIGGTLAVIWDKQALGATATTTAETFSWIFGLAFCAALGLAMADEQRVRHSD